LFALCIAETYWPIRTVIKGLAASTLAVLVWHRVTSSNGLLLGAALAFCSLGDILLTLPGDNQFADGLLSFLIAHLLFIVLWWRHWPKPLRITNWQGVVLAMLVIYILAMMAWILPVPGLSAAVAAYMIVLTTMVLAAVLVQVEHFWIGAGAILFLISDSLLALNKFKQTIEGLPADFLIWSTYYLALYLMTFGFVCSKKLTCLADDT
jgi:uncharacterized membrane protein YhhN